MVKTTASSKKSKSVKKPAAKTAKVSAKSKAVQKSAKVSHANKVDYYPNRMTVAVSALAGTLLVLFALIAVLGSR